MTTANLRGTYSQPVTFDNAGNSYSGSGAELTALDASQLLTGTVPDARLGGTYSQPVTFANAGNSYGGSGAGLTALDASQLLTGTVPDVRPHLERAAVFAAPLRVAAGIQNKILEALAMEMPVVTRAIFPIFLIANRWNGSAFIAHHFETCGKVRSVSVSPVGALSMIMTSYSASR